MKKGYLAAGLLCAAAGLCCLVLFYFAWRGGAHAKTAAPQGTVDFAALTAENPEIYAWLDIPGTDISYPIVQHSGEDDHFYLTHNSDGDPSADGAIFTEGQYNTKTFDDVVTVVYGHRLESGGMFSDLQSIYSDGAQFEAHREILVYLPERTLRYQVFAAVPYDHRHILHNYDFTYPGMYQAFFESIGEIRALNAQLALEDFPAYDTRVLVLSTCLQGDSTERYLVMAKLAEGQIEP